MEAEEAEAMAQEDPFADGMVLEAEAAQEDPFGHGMVLG